eukprot:scaffold75663_cov31-Tisochrysis_lutea.AAC.5
MAPLSRGHRSFSLNPIMIDSGDRSQRPAVCRCDQGGPLPRRRAQREPHTAQQDAQAARRQKASLRGGIALFPTPSWHGSWS